MVYFGHADLYNNMIGWMGGLKKEEEEEEEEERIDRFDAAARLRRRRHELRGAHSPSCGHDRPRPSLRVQCLQTSLSFQQSASCCLCCDQGCVGRRAHHKRGEREMRARASAFPRKLTGGAFDRRRVLARGEACPVQLCFSPRQDLVHHNEDDLVLYRPLT